MNRGMKMKREYFFWIVIIGILVIAVLKWGVEEKVHQGVADDISQYGLLKSYDEKERLLTYEPIEIIDENDTQRINQLRKQGVELDFPNGYFIYQPNKVQLTYYVSESVKVQLLDNLYTLRESSMEEVAKRLEGHPEFFLCKLHILGGNIVEMGEHFTP